MFLICILSNKENTLFILNWMNKSRGLAELLIIVIQWLNSFEWKLYIIRTVHEEQTIHIVSFRGSELFTTVSGDLFVFIQYQGEYRLWYNVHNFGFILSQDQY